MGTILFIKSTMAIPYAGADISMFERLSLLRDNFGWKVEVRSCAPTSQKSQISELLTRLEVKHEVTADRIILLHLGIRSVILLLDSFGTSTPQETTNLQVALVQEIETFSEKVLLGNVRDIPVLQLLIERYRNQSIPFVTENEFPRNSELTNLPDGKQLKSLYDNLNHFSVSTFYLQESFYEDWGLRGHIFFEHICFEHYSLARQSMGRFITITHPYAYKGIDLFLEIVAAMPDRQFLVLGGTGAEYRARKPQFTSFTNLVAYPFVSGIREIYKDTKILLVPSIWEEAFGRVVLEAMSSGIPVITSNAGGLPEVGGEAALCLPVIRYRPGQPVPKQNCLPWIEAIRSLDNPAYYSELSQRSFQHVENWKIKQHENLAELSKLISELIQ